MKLRLLKDSELPEVEARTKASGIPLTTCPTCGSKLEYREEWGGYEREFGSYQFRGQQFACDCDDQITLRKHYLLSNIPDQYQRLNWNDYDGAENTHEAVSSYLEHWTGFRANGVGIEFSGPFLGTGKTFSATHIGKELIKQGEEVFFISFRELVRAFIEDRNLEDRVKNIPILILDEVVPFDTQGQAALFSDKFESIIRHRTNWNGITIMTTNLTEDELIDNYPRVYSLLEAKQLRIPVEGSDARMGKIGIENIELAMAGEIRPIS